MATLPEGLQAQETESPDPYVAAPTEKCPLTRAPQPEAQAGKDEAEVFKIKFE